MEHKKSPRASGAWAESDFGISGYLLGEVGGNAFVVGLHCVGTFFPVHWADFTVLLEVLESVDYAEALTDGAAEWHIVHHLVANDAFFVDEEETTVGNEFAFDLYVVVFVDECLTSKNVVVFGDGLVDVCYEWVGNALDTTLVLRSVEPCPVGELRVCGAADYLDVASFELSDLFLEAVKLSRAYESEVFRVEEEYHVLLANELLEGEVLDDCFTLNSFC